MIAHTPQELEVWKLATELRTLVFALTSRQPASRDLRFRAQTEDAVSSVCRNLNEGFCRFNPGEFATFARYCEGSLGELKEQLRDGIEHRYWTEPEIQPAVILAKRTASALGRLRSYLQSRRAKENAKRITARRTGKARTKSARTKGTSGT